MKSIQNQMLVMVGAGPKAMPEVPPTWEAALYRWHPECRPGLPPTAALSLLQVLLVFEIAQGHGNSDLCKWAPVLSRMD